MVKTSCALFHSRPTSAQRPAQNVRAVAHGTALDNLTHSLVGALLGQTGLKRRTRLAMPALVIGANLPDVDGMRSAWAIRPSAMSRSIAATSPRPGESDADAFLVWSRAPFVERQPDGSWLLGDARFASRGARFSVALPPGTCAAI